MILVVALVAMVATAATAPLLARRFGRNAGYPLAVAFLVVGGVLAAQAPAVTRGDTPTASWEWMPSIGVSFSVRLDGLSFLFAILVLGVGALIMAYCPRYLDKSHAHGRLYLLLTLFAGSMLGLVVARDLVLLFVFWEITTLSSYFLITAGGTPAAVQPARRAFVVTASGGLALLAAVVLIAVTAGTTDLTTVLTNHAVVTDSALAPVIAGLIMVAAFTKSAQLPFHFWLPDAMVAITPVSAYLHAATLVKGGIYLLMRFSPIFADMGMWTITLIVVGLTTAVVGGAVALKQHDLKALLAYSTVSQLGFLVALTGVGTAAALAAAALHTFAHALFKATLFMLVGIIDREAGSRDLNEISGLRRVMPVTATLTGIAAGSMAGVPPFVGFVSKEEAFAAFLAADFPGWLTWVMAGTAAAAAALTFGYGFRILYGAFGGPTTQRRLFEPSFAFLAPAAVPAALGLVLGVAAGVMNPLVTRTVVDMTLTEEATDLALWHGFTAALALSGATIVVGMSLFVSRERVDRVLHKARVPITGSIVFDRLYEGSIRAGEWVAHPTRSGQIGHHLVWPLACLVTFGVAAFFISPELLNPPAPVTRPGDWLVVGLFVVSIGVLCLARSRLAAIAAIGVVGLVMGVWFLLAGAPDLAITQVLVEILTVVVAVLVLRELPGRLRRPKRRRRTVVAGVVAAAAGIVAGVGTFAAAGRRAPSDAANYLLTEGPDLSGGRNIVNTVLVDFRALDTLGEVTVLAVAGFGLMTFLGKDAGTETIRSDVPGAASDSVVVLRVAARLLVPVTLAYAVFLLLRGHYEPGGGFIAALVVGVGVALAQLPPGLTQATRLRPRALIRAGLALAIVVGAWGMAGGSFLQPLRGSLTIGPVDIPLTSSLIFDIGILLIVLGAVVAALDRMARGTTRFAQERT